MKLRLTCPRCDKGYLLDEEAAGGEFVCPACQTRIRVGVPARSSRATPAASPNRAAPSTASPTAPARTATPSAAAAVAAAPRVDSAHEAPAAPEMAVCPRCNLHFKLRGAAARPSSEQRPRVLLVEEHGYFRQIAEEALHGHCELETAATVNEAARILAGGNIDLMVLDDGKGKSLLGHVGSKPCPVLIYTARDETEMYGDAWDELQALGADDIVFQGMHVAESLSRKAAALLGIDDWGEDETD